MIARVACAAGCTPGAGDGAFRMLRRRTMKLRRSTMVTALGALFAAGVAFAQPAGAPGPGMMNGYGGWGGGPGMMNGYGSWGGGPRLGPALAQLDLSADQQQKIAAIHEDVRRK